MRKLLLLILFGISSSLLANVFDQFNSNQVCVAYKTTKGMFYLADVDVVGINCSVKVEIRSDKTMIVSIPVQKFNSDNSKRDSEVAIILGGSDLTPLRFEMQIPKDSNLDSIPSTITGKLYINGNANSVTLHLSKTSSTIRFQVKTKFSTLGIKVESVGPGGLIAKPKDDLFLYGQIPSKLIFE